VVSVNPAISEKKIVSFLRWDATSTFFSPLKILGEQLTRFLYPLFCSEKLFLCILELGDIGHHRHRATRGDVAAPDSVDTVVRCAVLESFTRGVAQTFHALGHKGVYVTVTVVPVLGKVA